MIVNLRGTNGSGKSTVVRQLMAAFPHTHDKAATRVYQVDLPRPLYVLGKYETACGGCDTIKTVAEVADLIDVLHPRGDVLFEGILISTTAGLIAERARAWPGFVFAFLDTPLRECHRRVEARRAAAGNEKPFNPKGMTDKYNTIVRLRSKLKIEGFTVADIRHQHAVEDVARLLGVEGLL